MLPSINTFEQRFGSLRYFLAPMAGITDTVFRTLMREMGAQVVISELISSEGLVRGGKKTRELLAFSSLERPVGIQLFGSQISKLADAARIVEQEGADFVDLNLGCPVRKVVCDGGGAAWLRNPPQLGQLLCSMKKAIRIPLSIKVRTGWDEQSKNVHEVAHIAAESGVSWVAIHGRTRAQGYSGLSDWELIRSVAHASRVPIIGNGDIIRAREAQQKLADGYAHAIMIGRGALKNPWIFQELLGHAIESKNFLTLIDRHFALAIERKDRTRAFLSLKKFLGWYAAGCPHCSTFRSRIFQTHNVDELKEISFDYFQSISLGEKHDDGNPFLMGGHG